MNRVQFEHLVRAAAAIVGRDQFVIIGSQAIHGSFPLGALPAEIVMSIELDIATIGEDRLDAQAASDLIDGSIGEDSMFQATYGVYAQGVDMTTATLPPGWEERLVPVPVNNDGAVAWCLEPHDLCASKLAAGREKDTGYVRAAIRHQLVEPVSLRERILASEMPASRRAAALGLVDRSHRKACPKPSGGPG